MEPLLHDVDLLILDNLSTLCTTGSEMPATLEFPCKIGCCSRGCKASPFCSYTMPGRMAVNVALRVVRMPWIRSLPYDAQTITRPNKEPGSKFMSKNCATESTVRAPFRSR